MQKNNLVDTLKKHNLWANKALGQHFLHDENICQRMVKHLDLNNEIIVEIGPGPGSLTYILKDQPFKFFMAIEKDSRFIDVLNDITSGILNFYLVNDDALKVSIPNSLKEKGIEDKYHIIANLPYNIGTELLLNWIDDIKNIKSITVMLQKEVVDRIKAKPDSNDYGRLSIAMQSCFQVQELFKISPGAFIPPPKVVSSVVFLKPLPDVPSKDTLKELSKITQIAFSQRRKMLRSTLGKQLDANLWQQICTSLKIDESSRPEILPPKTFLEIAKFCLNKLEEKSTL